MNGEQNPSTWWISRLTRGRGDCSVRLARRGRQQPPASQGAAGAARYRPKSRGFDCRAQSRQATEITSRWRVSCEQSQCTPCGVSAVPSGVSVSSSCPCARPQVGAASACIPGDAPARALRWSCGRRFRFFRLLRVGSATRRVCASFCAAAVSDGRPVRRWRIASPTTAVPVTATATRMAVPDLLLGDRQASLPRDNSGRSRGPAR
jgi:hypothetical protein